MDSISEETETPTPDPVTVRQLVLECGGNIMLGYGIHYLSTWAHEGSHYLVAWLVGQPAISIHVSWDCNGFVIVDDRFDPQRNSWGTFFIAIAGPLGGMASIIGMNYLIQRARRRFSKKLRQPNEPINFLTCIAGSAMARNMISLLPIRPGTDGDRALACFGGRGFHIWGSWVNFLSIAVYSFGFTGIGTLYLDSFK